jgi:hypothetical protein
VRNLRDGTIEALARGADAAASPQFTITHSLKRECRATWRTVLAASPSIVLGSVRILPSASRLSAATPSALCLNAQAPTLSATTFARRAPPPPPSPD